MELFNKTTFNINKSHRDAIWNHQNWQKSNAKKKKELFLFVEIWNHLRNLNIRES